jgi:hypothetical protein
MNSNSERGGTGQLLGGREAVYRTELDARSASPTGRSRKKRPDANKKEVHGTAAD